MLNLRYFFVRLPTCRARPPPTSRLTSLSTGEIRTRQEVSRAITRQRSLVRRGVLPRKDSRRHSGRESLNPRARPLDCLLIRFIDPYQSFVFFREMITRWDQIPTFLFLVVSNFPYPIRSRSELTELSTTVRRWQPRAERTQLVVVFQDRETDDQDVEGRESESCEWRGDEREGGEWECEWLDGKGHR